MNKIEPWEEVIINSTNHIFAKRMIKKIKEYRAKYKSIHVDSIAEQFATGDDETKKEWALTYNNMQYIVKNCRFHRRIRAEGESDAEDRKRKEQLSSHVHGNYGSWYE